MSWHCSRVLVEAFSEATCLVGAVSAPSSSTPTPEAFYWPDKTTEHSRLSRFGMTPEPLTAELGAELLTWFRAGSPARTYPLPERAMDWMASDQDSGPKWPGSFAKYDPATCSWRTHQRSLLGGLDEYLATWPRWGSMRDGESSVQPTPELHTDANESGFWQTPVADDAVSRPQGKWNSRGEPKLSAQVIQWPTPTVCGNYNRKGASATSGDGLATAVKNWPTPSACMSKGSSPAALTRKDGQDRSNDRLDHAVMAMDGGQLNPQWVEWLMAFPSGWTDLKPLGMHKFREWQQQHGNY